MDSDNLATALRRLELRLLDPATRKSRAELETLLTEDFVEFGSSGRFFDREAIITVLGEELPSSEAAVAEFQIVARSLDLAVVTYRISRTSGDENGPRISLRSSTWIRENGRWRMRFHQGTLAPADDPNAGDDTSRKGRGSDTDESTRRPAELS